MRVSNTISKLILMRMTGDSCPSHFCVSSMQTEVVRQISHGLNRLDNGHAKWGSWAILSLKIPINWRTIELEFDEIR